MQVLMRQVDRGEWKPPEPIAAPAEPEPTFQVFASIWLDRRQRRLAPKSVKQYEWALGHLLDFFGDDRLSQISAARIDKYRFMRREPLVRCGRPRGRAPADAELSAAGAKVCCMNDWQRSMITRAIAEDTSWISRARALITPDADCSSIEDDIADAQRDVDRMRALLLR